MFFLNHKVLIFMTTKGRLGPTGQNDHSKSASWNLLWDDWRPTENLKSPIGPTHGCLQPDVGLLGWDISTYDHIVHCIVECHRHNTDYNMHVLSEDALVLSVVAVDFDDLWYPM